MQQNKYAEDLMRRKAEKINSLKAQIEAPVQTPVQVSSDLTLNDLIVIMSNSNGYRKRSELLSEISNIYKIPASTAESKLDKILGKYVINHTESPIGMSSVPWNHSKYFFIKGFNTQYPHLYKENDIWKYMLEHNSNIPVKRGRPKKHVPQVKVFTPKEVQQKTQVTNPISNQPVVSEIGCHKGRDKGSFEKIFAKMGELLDRGIKRLADSL